MKYFGGCDSGSTYTKCVILDETGKMVADVTLRSRINSVLSCEDALTQAAAGTAATVGACGALGFPLGTLGGQGGICLLPLPDDLVQGLVGCLLTLGFCIEFSLIHLSLLLTVRA